MRSLHTADWTFFRTVPEDRVAESIAALTHPYELRSGLGHEAFSQVHEAL